MPSTEKPKLANRVVFFGDSICFGQGFAPHRSWVNRLSRELEDLCGTGLMSPIVHNASINGNTTRMALERMHFDVLAHGLDAMVLQFGLNDANYWLTDRGLPRVSLASFEAGLTEIIDRALRFGAKNILVHTNHVVTKAWPKEQLTPAFSYAESAKRYNDSVRRVAQASPPEVVLVDVEQAWIAHCLSACVAESDLLLPDGVHINQHGHDLYFNIVADPFRTMVLSLYPRSRQI